MDNNFNKVKDVIDECTNITEIIRKINVTDNGNSFKKIRAEIKKHKLDVSHFVKYKRPKKYKKIKRVCPKCKNTYETYSGGEKFKNFCNRKCANSRNWSSTHKRKLSEVAKKSKKVRTANIINTQKQKGKNKSKKNIFIKHAQYAG